MILNHVIVIVVIIIIAMVLVVIAQDALEEASARFTAMERRLLGDYSRMEKKYRKAKKLIKEFQQRYRLTKRSPDGHMMQGHSPDGIYRQLTLWLLGLL